MLGGKDWFRTGQTVLVETVELTRPNMWKVNAGYALPYGCPFGLQGERRAHKPLVAIGADRAPILHKFPFRQTDSDVMVEQAEEVIAAAITACLDKVEEDIERFTITAEPKVNTGGPSGTAVVSIRHVIEKKQQFVSMAKMWSEDQPIHVRLSAEGAKPCATGFIQSVQRQEHEQGFLLLATLFLTFQEAKGYDSWEDWDKIMDGAKMDVEPLHSRKTLMQRSSKFALHQFTEGAKDNSATGKIMAILMARQGERVPPALTWEELLVAHNPALNDLVGGQRKTAQLMLDTVPRVVYQQAPPGTGKTKVSMDIVAAHLRANPEAHVLFVAPLNVAVVKAVEEMAKTMTKIGWKEEMLALFSGSGKKKYFQELAKIGDHLLAAALRAPQLFERLDRQQSNVVKRYIKACETSPRTANEGKAAQILLGFEKRRIVFCTLSLAEQIGGIFGDTDMIVVDESGQASFAQLMSTLLNFPALGKLLVTGDKWQLKVNLEDVPDATRVGCGLDTVIINLDEAAGVDRTTLTVNFRSHPMLTQCIEAGVYAAHGEKLISGRSAEEMNRITVSTPIFLPVQDCPLVLLHQTDRMVQDPTSFSATNPEQTRTVVNCVAMLRPRLTGLIRIVCFYAGQAKELGMAVNELNYEDVLVTTADGCQGHEAEFVFVVTTKAGLSAMDASGAFWNDERRVNVALSRAKFGMMVIGDLKLLWQAGGIWRRFLRKALESTIAVAPEYIEAMANPSSEYIDGMLNGPNGPVKAADFYDEWSGGSGFDPIPQQMASAHRPATSSSQAPSPRRGPSTSSPGSVPNGVEHRAVLADASGWEADKGARAEETTRASTGEGTTVQIPHTNARLQSTNNVEQQLQQHNQQQQLQRLQLPLVETTPANDECRMVFRTPQSVTDGQQHSSSAGRTTPPPGLAAARQRQKGPGKAFLRKGEAPTIGQPAS
uniref:AAA_12 domain-containing protein n=1 Tax=Globodera pallida TaxID=36090 RepID=A0A183CLS0_GLOPA